MTMLLCGGMAFAQSGDPVIMTIAGQPVHRSEFEYSYNKNNAEGVIDKKTVDEYVDLFINYKLKVQAALDAKLDTMKSYQQEFRTYRDQQITPSFVTDEAVEKEARQVYQSTKDAIGPRGLIMPAHILVLLNQKATDAEQKAAKVRIDSIYQALKQGADFSELAKKVSQDPGSAKNGGVLPWIGPNQTLKEFEDAAYALKVGEMSQPVLSPAGWHVITMSGLLNFRPRMWNWIIWFASITMACCYMKFQTVKFGKRLPKTRLDWLTILVRIRKSINGMSPVTRAWFIT